MTDAGPAPAPDDGEAGSWASETLPLALRRELLQRELKKLGIGIAKGAEGSTGPSATDGAADEQQGDPHPQAASVAQHGS